MSNLQNVPAPMQNTAIASPISCGKVTMYSARCLPFRRKMEWIIDGIFPRTGLACVFGASGVGKSLFCVDIAARIGSGMDWNSHPTKQGRVVYICLEGGSGIPIRVDAWAKHHGVPFPENVQFVFDPIAINSPDDVLAIINLCKKWGGADVIIIDTLNRSAPGAEENSSSDMGKIIAGASALQKAIDGLVLVVHHSGKESGRGMRGHSSLHAAQDAVLEVKRNEGGSHTCTLVKSKDGEDGVSHSFNLVTVELGTDESGKVDKSCVIEEIDGAVATKTQAEPSGKHQKPVLAAAREIIVNQRAQRELGMQDAPEGIPFQEMLSKATDALENVDLKHRRQRATEALGSLIDQGYLTLEGNLLTLRAS